MDDRDGGAHAELSRLVDLFVSCMREEPGSAAHREGAHRFNRAYERYVRDHPNEDVGAFALRVAALGIPFDRALPDVVHVRGLGVGEEP